MYSDRYESGNRDGWEFEYQGAELVTSTRKQFEYHAGREEYWSSEAKKMEGQIRDSGISLEEYAVTGGTRFEAKIDTSLGARLTECRAKEKEHRVLREQFEGFLHEFERPQNTSHTFKLKLADLRFFGLVGDAVKFGEVELS